jgi:hypothetical protein
VRISTLAWGLLATSLLAGNESWATNVAANGSFETPTVAPGTFTNFSVGSSLLTDWSVVGSAGQDVSIVSGSFAQNGVTFNAEDGSQWLDLTGDGSNSTEGVSQTITTIAGDKYQLSYYIGNTSGGGIFGTRSTVDGSFGGVAFSDTNSIGDTTGLNWTQFTHTFVATGTSATLIFRSGDPSSDNSNGLDNIVVTDLTGGTTSKVPEIDPASAGSALVLLLGGVAVLRGRRTYKNGPATI